MKKYSLQMVWPVGFGSANKEITNCFAVSLIEAIQQFRLTVPQLNDNGYFKENEITHCVCEYL